MIVKLVHDTLVWHKQGEILELPEKEGRRLIAFGNALPEEKKEKKKTK